MRSINTFLRFSLSIAVGIAFIAAMPVYDEPFGGCTARGYATLELGCSLWFDVLLGFGIVFLVAFLARIVDSHNSGGLLL